MPTRSDTRPRGFVFDVDAYLNDPAVRAMGVMGRGAYGGGLLPSLWNQPEPGVVEDDDELLASLALCTREEWSAVRDRVARAFDTTSRPGVWIQKRMVEERAAQMRWTERQRQNGSRGGKSAARNRFNRPGTGTLHSSPGELGNDSGNVARASELSRPATASLKPARSPLTDCDSSGVIERSALAEVAARSARTRRHRVPRSAPDRTLPDAFVSAKAAQYRVPLETARHLAERVMLEFDAQGYVNARSALLKFLRVEAESIAKGVGAARPAADARRNSLERRNGDRAKDPQGRPIVWWHGSWVLEDEARHAGWKPRAGGAS